MKKTTRLNKKEIVQQVGLSKINKLIVVVGMHRSGTSAISAGLQVLGINLGDKLLPPVSGDNDKGYYEDVDITTLNVEILSAINADWFTLTTISSLELTHLRKQGYFLRAVNLLRQKMTMNFPLFGFKDPRVAKLLPFWNDVFAHLNLHVNYVFVVRHPLSVVKSLEKRINLIPEQAYLLWLTHIMISISNIPFEKSVCVDYDRHMRSPDNELNRIATAFDLKIDQVSLHIYKTEFLDAHFRHTFFEFNDLFLDVKCPPIVREIYGFLLQISSDHIKIDEPHLIKDIEKWKYEFKRFGCFFQLADILYKEKINIVNSLTHKDGQIVELRDTVVARDGQILSLNKQLLIANTELYKLIQEQATFGASIGRLFTKLRAHLAPVNTDRGVIVGLVLKLFKSLVLSGWKTTKVKVIRDISFSLLSKRVRRNTLLATKSDIITEARENKKSI